MAWVCTEAVRTQSRVLGMDSVGEARARLRNQIRRLFNAHVQLVYQDKPGPQPPSAAATTQERTVI